MTLGERVKIKREELGLSQEELATKMGYKSKTSIHKIEQGITDLPLSKVNDLAKVLKVTSAYLMGWEEKQEKEFPEIDLSILTEDERKQVEDLMTMSSIMFMKNNNQEPLSEHDRYSIITAFIEVLISRRPKKK